MVDMFVEKMCNYCSNNSCNKKRIINIERTKNCTSYKCEAYKKDASKIVPYEKPLLVTAPRDYVSNAEN